MPGYETLNAYVSDVTALTAATIDPSQSLTVRTPDTGSPVRLLGFWRKGTVAAPFRLRSNRMHDDVQGLRIEGGSTYAVSALDNGIQTPLVAADVLTAETYDASATNSNLGILIGYDSIGGSNGNFATWDQIKPRIMALMGVSLDIPAAGTLSEYSAGISFDQSTNLMKAGYDYAVLGYETENGVCTVALGGPATGSLKFGGPGVNNPLHTRTWFADLSMDYGLATIPVIHQADKPNTFAYQADNAAGATNTVTFLCAQLSS